uniref:Histidine--tRNA ligase, chloroplastic n=1 Tax=Thorea hispida TaxID=202687 RepID=A0A1Z1XAC4_9FLOR|nr:histidine tRNA synthetase [Thorea hispida]
MQSIRGMHDILPDEIEYWQHIYLTAIKILGLAGYREIRTPILEQTSLFSRSIGEGTDIVNKEMYTFTDRNNRSLTLRPENTASIARAIIEHKLLFNQQIQKLWYLGPMFRYERPQKGRQRQFHQLGIECCGSYSALADAEIIYLAKQFLDILNYHDYKIEINSLGSIKERKEYQIVLKNYLQTYIKDLDTDSQIKLELNPIKILDSKNNQVQAILSDAPKLISYLNINTLKHLDNVQEYLHKLDIQYSINYNLVRGLDYYTNTVFEIKTQELNTQYTICGGGRYNQLIETLGGSPTACTGWAIGIERLLLLIKNKIAIKSTQLVFYIATQGHEAIKYALTFLKYIQEQQLKFEIDFSNKSFHKQIKKANQQNALICLLIGEDEVINNCVKIQIYIP